MTCPWCRVPLIVLTRKSRTHERLPASEWVVNWGCGCCGATWRRQVDPACRAHPLAWLPQCQHVGVSCTRPEVLVVHDYQLLDGTHPDPRVGLLYAVAMTPWSGLQGLAREAER